MVKEVPASLYLVRKPPTVSFLCFRSASEGLSFGALMRTKKVKGLPARCSRRTCPCITLNKVASRVSTCMLLRRSAAQARRSQRKASRVASRWRRSTEMSFGPQPLGYLSFQQRRAAEHLALAEWRRGLGCAQVHKADNCRSRRGQDLLYSEIPSAGGLTLRARHGLCADVRTC